MPKLKLFQYAVLLHKKSSKKKVANSEVEDEDSYEGTEMIVEPSTILAKSEKDAVFIAIRKVPEDKAKNPEDVEVIIRPF